MAAKSKSNQLPPKIKNVPVVKSSTRVRKPARTSTPPTPLTHTFLPGFWRAHWVAALALLLLAIVLYGLSVQFGYILDDEIVISKNSFVQNGWSGIRQIFAADSFLGYFKEPKFLLEGGRYRPLSLATFAAEVGIFGKDNPNLMHISHGINILLYGLTGILLYRILIGLFPLSEGGRWYFSVAFLGSTIFLLHPLHVEVVANIKGRDEILALIGSLGALWAVLKYYDTNRFWWLLLAGLSLFLAMLSKENAITFVAVIPLTVWVFAKVPVQRLIGPGVVLLLSTLLFILVRYQALGYMLHPGKTVADDLMNNPFLGMTGGERLATIFLTLGWYVKLLFIPHPLTHDYYPYHVPKVGWADWRALASLVLYLGMATWAVLNLRKRRVIAWCILYFLLTLSIVSNLFVSVGTFMNERFAYIPSVAFCVLVGWFFARLLPSWIKEQPDRPSIVGAMMFLAVAALFGWRTSTRIPDWKDEMALNVSAIQVSENSARSHCFYVTSLYKNQYQKAKGIQEKTQVTQEMEYHVKRALDINPNYSAALIMRSAVAVARFDLDHQLDKLFHEFEYIMERIPYNTNFRDFVDQNMTSYLDGSNS
ncbi:MAG: hypothetical protein ABIQ93_04730, partial [Saprospiraceae bacterium]